MTGPAIEQVGLIGWPVEHSVSPAMHNAAFAALGLGWHYVALPVLPEELVATVRRLAGSGYRGLNVTTPHKQAVIALLDSVAADAQALGAVNTLVIDTQGQRAGGRPRIAGHNTDVEGFIRALRHAGFEPSTGGPAVVVGAGGGARAVVYGLLGSGVKEVVVINRTLERATALISDLARCCSPSGGIKLSALPFTPEVLVESARGAGLLVNTTTVGMWPHSAASIWPAAAAIPPDLAVCDLVYNPPETELLRRAHQSGALPLGGLEMLVQQGALAFELWTGQPPPVEVMRAAARAALRC